MNKKFLFTIGVILFSIFAFLIWHYWLGVNNQDNKEINLETTKLATISQKSIPLMGMGLRITFSPDGRKVAYTPYKDDKWFVVLNEKEYGPYEGVCYYASTPVFSLNSESFVYTAQKEKDGGWYLFFNNEEIGPYDMMYDLLFSPDSNNFAYVAQRGGKRFIVFNNQEGNSYDTITDLVFSSDSRRFAYMARRDNKWFAVLDGQEQKQYDDKCYFGGTSPTFSPNSKSLAYCAKKNNTHLVVINGEEKGPYDLVSDIGFSLNSKDFFYKAVKGARSFAVINGVEKGKDVNRFAFSPNGDDFVYSVEKSPESYIIYNGKKIASYDFRRKYTDVIRQFKFSLNSKDLVYLVEENFHSTHLVINKERREDYYMINNFVFSPDSKHFAFIEGKRTFSKAENIVLDGKSIGISYDDIYPGPYFTSDSKFLYYGALIRNELWWIVENVE